MYMHERAYVHMYVHTYQVVTLGVILRTGGFFGSVPSLHIP
jgi:hypothetical protein